MKKILTLLATLAAVTTASAQLYTGVSAGYLIDSEEEYFTARIGYEVARRASLIHSVEVEVGLLSESEGGAKLELIPLMANYRGAVTINEKLNLYFGGGAGAAFVNVKMRSWGIDESDQAFAVQAFSGVEYQASKHVSLVAGVRYLWIDEVWGVKVGDDVAVEAGLKIRF